MKKYHNASDLQQISFMVVNDSDPKYMGKMEKKKQLKRHDK